MLSGSFSSMFRLEASSRSTTDAARRYFPPSPSVYPQTYPDIHRCGQLRRQFPCWYKYAQQGMFSIAPLSHQIHCPHPQPHHTIGHISVELIAIKLDQLHHNQSKLSFPSGPTDGCNPQH